jgi:serine/threonine protein kinase
MAERIQQIQHAFTAYAIERELGRGGMATVYLAHDKKHDRKVAIKVLHAELAAVLGAERFLQEIRVTANLQHPHILGAAKWIVSTNGGTEPRWSHRGNELFYRDGAGNMVAVEVKTRPVFSVIHSTILFSASRFARFVASPQYDVSADDQRFLMLRPVVRSGSDRLIVVENWFEELKAKSRK